MLFTFLLVGLLLGYFYRDFTDFVKTVNKRLDERKPEVGATPASYGRINEFNYNQDGQTGLVRPKTPQQLEWEEQERLREAQINVSVKPRN